MELRSQKVRELAPEMDPLRMGMRWEGGGAFQTTDHH